MIQHPLLQVRSVPVTNFEQNCSIIMCQKTRRAAIVDPGGDIDRIVKALDEMQAIADQILLTHAHIDHAGATADVAERFNIDIVGPHRDDDFWIQSLPQQSMMFGFPAARSFTPTRWLEDNDEVQIGEIKLTAIHCPGHTPGHIVFYQADARLAIVGDVIFNGSIGRTDFPKGNHQQLIDSIRNKLFPLGDDIEFICGHGPNSTFGHERQTNPFVADHRG